MPWTLLPVWQGSFVLDFCAVNSVSRRKTHVCLVCVAKGETKLFVLRGVCVKEQILFIHSFGEVFQLLWRTMGEPVHQGALPAAQACALGSSDPSVPVCSREMLYLGCISVL